MQAWVTNAGQNAPAAPTGPHVHDHQGSPHKRAVYQTQSQPAPITTAQNNSPPQQPHSQSRMPIINANANRPGSALATRVSTTRPVANHIGHGRDGSVSSQRNNGFASEPLRQSQRGKPFWDGSTVDGSVFSDSASNNDSRISNRHHGPVVESGLKQGAPRQHQVKRESGELSRPPFTINSQGFIDVVNDARAPGLQRSSSTPDARARGQAKGLPRDDDSLVDEIHYQTAPDISPPNPSLNRHRARLPLRGTQQLDYSNRTPYPNGHNPMSSPPREAYQTPATGLEDDEMEDDSELLRDDEDHGPHRSTVFVDVETPIVSHRAESAGEETDQQTTPKPAVKRSPQVNRQLFSKASKSSRDRNSLHESAMPRAAPEKRHPSSKKRHFEPDYDDGALAAMQYDNLRNEDFDYDPAQAESQSTLLPRQGTLPDKLQHYLGKDQEAQSAFFTSMPVGEWDDAGDWFLEKFGGVMNRLKEARQAKRQMVEDFEHEVAEREDAVRYKIGGIDRTLVELKSEGAKMMSRTDFE
ncbi:hypothetical protein PG994_013224 [Apiospora phragmitis]|uniref:Extracellular mutant protein 11 C-terminal domain-containing protein n=1 Tax=Apiospora phragmitis TaxID=2905665 RepID=A0ABR1T9Q3_9PEZI